jgi:vacuolar-type H+-ATPase subunit I/STV1
MINIVFGLVAICLGLWGLVKYWWYVVDIIIAIFPLVLLFVGIIALLAGIKNTGLKATLLQRNNQEATEPTMKKKDI